MEISNSDEGDYMVSSSYCMLIVFLFFSNIIMDELMATLESNSFLSTPPLVSSPQYPSTKYSLASTSNRPMEGSSVARVSSLVERNSRSRVDYITSIFTILQLSYKRKQGIRPIRKRNPQVLKQSLHTKPVSVSSQGGSNLKRWKYTRQGR